MNFDWWPVLERFRNPEYTGSNRCPPCTVVNVVIAAVLAVGASLASPLLGVIVIGVSLSLIYLRGYLIPGTPTLTKRYVPARMLGLFGKEPVTSPLTDERDLHAAPDDENSGATSVQDWPMLDRTGVFVECPERDDLCLEEGFRESWRENILALRSNERRQRTLLAGTLDDDIEPDAVTIDEGDHEVEASVDGTTIGEWPSRAALVADLAAGALLAEQDPQWTETSAQTRGTALARLRIFLETCPTCGEPVDFHEEDGSACCWSREVITVRCTGCDARLLEVDELSFDDGETAFL